MVETFSMSYLNKKKKIIKSKHQFFEKKKKRCTPCLIFGQRLSGTYILEVAEHFCPLYSKAPRTLFLLLLEKLIQFFF